MTHNTVLYVPRFDTFLGYKRSLSRRQPETTALLRTVSRVYGVERSDDAYRLIIISGPAASGFMSSLQLYSMGFYSIGAVKPCRIDYSRALPARLPRLEQGGYQVASVPEFPRLKAVAWNSLRSATDHFLTLGGSVEPDAVPGKSRSGARCAIQCPRVVKDYVQYSKSAHKHFLLQR